MERSGIRKRILELEWEMFRSVNGDLRVSCQENQRTFVVMRKAQLDAWSDEVVNSYLSDLETAKAAGRNLMREKYIRMMEVSDPDVYQVVRRELPEVSEQQRALVEEIWRHLRAQTERMRVKYPALARRGRPLSAEEQDDWASVEVYQKSELLTYSEATVQALMGHLLALEEQGVDLTLKILENSMLGMGFTSLEEAEQAASRR